MKKNNNNNNLVFRVHLIIVREGNINGNLL